MQGFQLMNDTVNEMVFIVPSELQEKLTTISDSEIDTVIVEWSKIEEFGGQMTPENCKEYLHQVRDFLKNRTDQLYLVMEL